MGRSVKERGTASAAVPEEPTHEMIAARAYELYLFRGGEPGHELDDWFAAEEELRIRLRSVRADLRMREESPRPRSSARA